MPEKRVMTIDELAMVLGIGRTLARRLAREDSFPPPIRVIRLGRRLLVSRDAVEELLATGTN